MRAGSNNSIGILICLLCNIYRNKGYYIVRDKDLPFLIADVIGVSEGVVSEVIIKAVQVGFFNQTMYEKYNIITSKEIQNRYLKVCKDAKRNGCKIKKEYSLIQEETELTTEETELIPEETELTTEESTQSKVKNSKVKESKVKNRKEEISKSHCVEKSPHGKKDVTLYWKKIVQAWYDFFSSKFSNKPTFDAISQKSLKLIVQNLKQRTEEAGIIWSEENAVATLNKFLELAYSDSWLKNNFQLKNLNSQFDKIINLNKQNGTNYKTGSPFGNSAYA